MGKFSQAQDVLLVQRAEELMEWLRSQDKEEFFETIKNPVEIHARVFAGMERKGSQYAGVVRTQKVVVRYLTEGRVQKKARLLPPEKMNDVLSLYRGVIDDIASRESFDDGGVVIDLCNAMFLFFKAHPFLDGNGHVMRAVVKAVCERLGIPLSAAWTIHPRPYDRHFSYCIRHFRSNPYLFFGAVSQFVLAPDRMSGKPPAEGDGGGSDGGDVGGKEGSNFDTVGGAYDDIEDEGGTLDEDGNEYTDDDDNSSTDP